MMNLNKDIRLLIKSRPNFPLPIKVHIDELSAMNGVSLFSELRNSTLVHYSKQENLHLKDKLRIFDRLLTGNSDIVRLSGGRLELRAATLGFHRIRNRIKISKENLKRTFLKLFERKSVKITELVEDVESIIKVEDDLESERGDVKKEKKKKKKRDEDTQRKNIIVQMLSIISPIHIEMKDTIFHYSNQHVKKDEKKRKKK